jgi:hypothetical protein
MRNRRRKLVRYYERSNYRPLREASPPLRPVLVFLGGRQPARSSWRTLCEGSGSLGQPGPRHGAGYRVNSANRVQTWVPPSPLRLPICQSGSDTGITLLKIFLVTLFFSLWGADEQLSAWNSRGTACYTLQNKTEKVRQKSGQYFTWTFSCQFPYLCAC